MSVPREVIEAFARFLDPDLFSDDPVLAHRAASPFAVEYARSRALEVSSDKVDVAISALEAAGIALVPVEPTARMLRCGVREFAGAERYARDYEYCDANFTEKARAAWTAMLTASRHKEKDDG